MKTGFPIYRRCISLIVCFKEESWNLFGKEIIHFTLDEIYFRVPIVVGVVIGLIPIHKGWGTFKSLFSSFE